MSYFIWWIFGDRGRYPTGAALLVLYALRVADYVAMLFAFLFASVFIADLAIDARAYFYFKDLNNQYNHQLVGEEGLNENEHYTNYRMVVRQQALMGWYGQLLIAQEGFYDSWKSLFKGVQVRLFDIYPAPFFLHEDINTTSNSLYEFNGRYKDERTIKSSLSPFSTRLAFNGYDLGHVYMTHSYKYIGRNSPNGRFYEETSECAKEVVIDESVIERSLGGDAVSIGDIQAQLKQYKEVQSKYDDDIACLTNIQKELGIKTYPPKNMVDYNKNVLNYKISVAEKALDRVKKNNLSRTSKIYIYPYLNDEYNEKMYKLHAKDNCRLTLEGDKETCENSLKKIWPKSTFLNKAFYDIAVKNNEVYRNEGK